MYTPVGGSAEKRVDVRLVAATHRNLMADVAAGCFREDLFYRVAVGVLHLPPLREREGDLLLLCEALLAVIGRQDTALAGKKISAEGKKLVLQHAWPGNVRELQATLVRAALWCQGDTIEQQDMAGALFDMPAKTDKPAGLDVSQGIDIQALLGEFVRPYLERALQQTAGNKTRAAKLLGLKSQQTLTNWMEKYGIE